jgi:hypothetical protein
MEIPYPSWEVAHYKIGQTVRFYQYRKPETITTGTVVGWADQDRILVDHVLPNGVMRKGASIHVKMIISD